MRIYRKTNEIKKPRRTDEQKKAIFEEYTLGEISVRALAEKHKCSTRTIYNIVQTVTGEK